LRKNSLPITFSFSWVNYRSDSWRGVNRLHWGSARTSRFRGSRPHGCDHEDFRPTVRIRANPLLAFSHGHLLIPSDLLLEPGLLWMQVRFCDSGLQSFFADQGRNGYSVILPSALWPWLKYRFLLPMRSMAKGVFPGRAGRCVSVVWCIYLCLCRGIISG